MDGPGCRCVRPQAVVVTATSSCGTGGAQTPLQRLQRRGGAESLLPPPPPCRAAPALAGAPCLGGPIWPGLPALGAMPDLGSCFCS